MSKIYSKLYNQDQVKMARLSATSTTILCIILAMGLQPNYPLCKASDESQGQHQQIGFDSNGLLIEDHSNVDLDKIGDSHRYLTIESVQNDVRPSDESITGLSRLLSNMLHRTQGNNYLMRNQIELKRSLRELDATKEDKDYTFVVDPLNKYSINRPHYNSDLMDQTLRDMILTDGIRFYRTSAFKRPVSNPFYSNQASADKDGPASREKRRRCKVDPNLGVKNPSFCDTEAYFGAADYSMRDVWDSAGRR